MVERQDTKELFEFVRKNNPHILAKNVLSYFNLDSGNWLHSLLDKTFKIKNYQDIVSFDGLWVEDLLRLGGIDVSMLYGLGVGFEDSEHFKFFISEIDTFVHHQGEAAIKLDFIKQ